MKKVGLLTMGLTDNYGGILQAIALYSFIQDIGYDVVLLRKYPIESNLKRRLKKILRVLPFQNIRGLRISNIKYQNNFKFWSKYIENQTPIFTHKSQIEKYIDDNLSSIVVGSDQVWRYSYINDSEYDIFFLNLNLKKRIKKIAYAASFGIDKWEAPELNEEVGCFLRDFTSVSVREDSGIDICSNSFNYYNVSTVLDPTLLIGADFFKDMVKEEAINRVDSINYVLDNNENKKNVINKINLHYSNFSTRELLNKSSILSISEWVASFRDAKMIITDSFHGMVFSILFEKEFFVIINNNRGADRFTSLCKKLDLMDRLITEDEEHFDFKAIKPLNYSEINKRLSILRNFSSEFLIKSLS